MKKILINIGTTIITVIIFALGLYTSELLHGTTFFIGGICDVLGLVKYDIYDESCYHAFCCEPLVAYLFYMLLIYPISYFLFIKKQKLPAIFLSTFGAGIIFGTFIFFLVMP